jgi:hypothetical protein
MNANAEAIAAFVEGVRTGEWEPLEEHYHPDVKFHGTVPRWHFPVRGRPDVIEQMGKWFPYAAELNDLHVTPTEDGAVVEFERRWQRPGDGEAEPEEVGVRQAHVLRLDAEGRIIEQRGHCAGIWDAATFAEIEAAHATV